MSRGAEQPVTSLPESTRQQDRTFIAKGINASGVLSGAGTVLIEGALTGKIKLDGAVTIAESGVVRGPIAADTLYVSGAVKGNVAARTCLRLNMSGSIEGDVMTRSFVIEDGGYFNGQSRMTKSDAEPIILYESKD